MCEANVYLYEDGKEELILESVDRLVPKDHEIYIENIFGHRRTLFARIKELRLVDHRIILERVPEPLPLEPAVENN
jgi:predicted RNA-binding protein